MSRTCDRAAAYAKAGMPCPKDAAPVKVRKLSGAIVDMTLCSGHKRAYGSAIVTTRA